ncbi:MAG: outer membrane protein assembly factor BamE [Planctomycetes bacterium]|nr:outer membrane protein assembly factor BamE [Planctomycetota bacterium]
MKKIFVIQMLCLTMSGCYAINRDNLNKIEIGMSREQVREIMGKPRIREADKDQERWLYHTERSMVYTIALTPVVFNKDGKVIGWGRHFWSEKERKYDVKIDQTIKQE